MHSAYSKKDNTSRSRILGTFSRAKQDRCHFIKKKHYQMYNTHFVKKNEYQMYNTHDIHTTHPRKSRAGMPC